MNRHSVKPNGILFLGIPIFILCLLLSLPAQAGDAEDESLRAEYGVTLALKGKIAESEEIFLSMLGESPGDACALNNLGNLSLLRGDQDVALVFYDRALQSGEGDPAIHLNRAITYMLIGDAATAVEEARLAMEPAGSVDEAAALLGLRRDQEQGSGAKADDASYLNAEEVLALLDAAALDVLPAQEESDTELAANADSSIAGSEATSMESPESGRAPKTKKPKLWRSAGPRAADRSDTASLLYWKR